MFVGGVVLCIICSIWPGVDCNLWKWPSIEEGIVILYISHRELRHPYGSITNIATIALERVHATFFPLRHRVLKKWVHRLIIAVVWVTSGLANQYLLPFLLAESGEIYYGLWLSTYIFVNLPFDY